MACVHGKRLCRPCEREAERAGTPLLNNDMLSKHAAIAEEGRVYTGMGRSLSKELDMLEDRNPAVRAAARRIDRAVEDINQTGEETSKTVALMMSIGEAPTPERAKALLATMFGRYPRPHQLRKYRADLHRRGATYG